MSHREKVRPTHLERVAYVYVRQSTSSQVQHNRESTDRQYGLANRAVELGWPPSQVQVLDEDLAQSGAESRQRRAFTTMTAQVALGQVGLILSIEVSRVARNNSDWYRLLDLCAVTDTLIGDEDGLYHPGLFNDRLLLGLKGTMAEAELHVLRARLDGGIRNKAARGELRRGLPVGFIWGDEDGEVLLHPDQAVSGAIRTVFEKFAEMGSVRRVWLWFLSQGLSFPLQSRGAGEIQWPTPTYRTFHHVLTNPVYAGAYAYGKTRSERYLDPTGRLRTRLRRLPRSQWTVLIPDHHPGYIDWDTYEMNLRRISQNTHPRPHEVAGAVREGAALLQGLATCGRCGRKLRVYYRGRNSLPGYYCSSNQLVNGRGTRCLQLAGVRIDQAVAKAFLEAAAPAGLEAALEAQDSLEVERDAALAQWRRQVERARYEAERAERRYRSVEPENRLVTRTLESQWEKRLADLTAAETELARREHQQTLRLSEEERRRILALGTDLRRAWEAPTTTVRDRKQLLRTLLQEVNISLDKANDQAHLILRWKGGLMSELDVALSRRNRAPLRTDEQTVDLVRRLARHYSDAVIAGILNRQGRKTAQGLSFTANRVGNVRRHWQIPRFQPGAEASDAPLLTVQKAAKILGVAASTVHRWLADGFIAGEQITPGAPWRIRMTEELRERFVEQAPPGYVPMGEATRRLGVSRQTVLQRVKRGELSAVHVRKGRRKGLRIKVIGSETSLFDSVS